jgi:hypothetical protein
MYYNILPPPLQQFFSKLSSMYIRIPLLHSCNLHFPLISNIFSGPFIFPILIMYFYSFMFPKFQTFCNLCLECIQKEQFWHKAASTDKLLVSTCLSCTTITIHWLAMQLRRIFIYIALQNENGVSYEISSSHGSEYEVQICLLGCTAM